MLLSSPGAAFQGEFSLSGGAEEFGEPVGEEVGEFGVEGFVGREVVALKEFGNEECEFEALFFGNSGFAKLVAVHWFLLCALQCAPFFLGSFELLTG